MDESTPTHTQTPAAPTTATTPALSAAGPSAELTEAEAAKMSGWIKDDLAKGKITQAQADQAFAELNTPLEQRLPDARSTEERQLDAAFPVASPEAYRITYADVGQDPPVMTPEQKAFDSSARTWLSGAGFPRDVGNSLVNAITKVAQQTKAMTADQLETYGTAEFAKLERAHGAALEERLQAAGRMVEDLERKQPGLKNLLKSKGIGDNAMVASLLIQQAERYWARKGR